MNAEPTYEETVRPGNGAGWWQGHDIALKADAGLYPSDAEAVAPQSVREALIGIAERGYVPGRTHPHRPWWDRMFPGVA